MLDFMSDTQYHGRRFRTLNILDEGVRQGGAPGGRADARVVELGRLRRQAGLDVAEAFPVGQLGERQDAKVLSARERPHAAVAPGSGRRFVRGSSKAGNPSTVRTGFCRRTWVLLGVRTSEDSRDFFF